RLSASPHRPVPVRLTRARRTCAGRRRARRSLSRGRILRIAFAVAVVAALIGGALLLLPSAVPDDLVRPHVDVGGVFGAARVARAARYERFLYADWVLAQVALFAVLVVYARRGAAYARESAAGPIGTGMLLG